MTNIDMINGQNKILFCKKIILKIILHQLVPNNCILSTLGKKIKTHAIKSDILILINL